MSKSKKGRVIGIGGIFFKSDSPQEDKAWYKKHLGVKTDQWGAPFVSRKYSNSKQASFLQWSPFEADTKYFLPSELPFMINYRVENMEELVQELKEDGVTICDEIVTYDYGKFVHIMDGKGRKVELWEPVDEEFDKVYSDKSAINHE